MLPGDLLWLCIGAAAGALVGLLASRRVAGAWHRPVAVALASAHLGAVLGVTLLPVGPQAAGVSNVALEPFGTVRQLIDGSQSVRQLGGNLLLLAPMGVLAPIAWRAVRSWPRTVLLGLAVSVGIELGQLALNVLGLAQRVIDVDDVVLNVIGVAFGRLVFALGWFVQRSVTRGRRRPR